MDITEIPVTTRTRVDYGVELPWERVERYGPMPGANGVTLFADHPPKGTVIESGTTFVELNTLEELLDADHSLGMGDAFLVGYREGMALEKAGLARQEIRGGYFTRDDERARLTDLITRIYAEMDK